MAREEFLDLLGAVNLIPGPNSTEMAIHVGMKRAGWPGLLVAGTSFILPAATLVLALAWAYVRFGTLPQAAAILYGVKPVVIAVVVQAIWGLGRAAIKTPVLGVLGVTAAAATIAGMNELSVLGLAGMLGAVAMTARRKPVRSIGIAMLGVPATTPAAAFGLTPLFLTFLKIGAVLFGSGYVLLAFLRADLVERLHWMTESQLLDAVAVGQVTPGPVFTTATFVGYILGGTPGAIAATVGIFLPAFAFVAVGGPLVSRLRRSKTAGGFLDGVNVASLALMAVVAWQLGRAALVDAPTIAIAAVAAFALVRVRINSAWLVLAGAVAGWLVRTFRG